MAVEARDIGGASPRQGGASRRVSWRSAFGWLMVASAVVVWLLGLEFTRRAMLPLVGASLAWYSAIGAQVALSVAQSAWRSMRQRIGWVGLALVVVDVGLNLVGLLDAYGAVAQPSDAPAFVIDAAFAGGDAAVSAAIALFAAVLVALTPETFARIGLEEIK